MTIIVVRRDAAADIEEAFAWYEAQRSGLGNDFRSELRTTLERVAQAPERYPVVLRSTQRVFMRRFPYGVFYRVYPEVIVVVAVMHARRDPQHWRSRT